MSIRPGIERMEDWLRREGERSIARVNAPFPQLLPADAIRLADLVAAVRARRMDVVDRALAALDAS